jgi:hypothetical protein
MRLTGHKTEAVYRRYAIVDETMLREGVEKLAAYQSADRSSLVLCPINNFTKALELGAD